MLGGYPLVDTARWMNSRMASCFSLRLLRLRGEGFSSMVSSSRDPNVGGCWCAVSQQSKLYPPGCPDTNICSSVSRYISRNLLDFRCLRFDSFEDMFGTKFRTPALPAECRVRNLLPRPQRPTGQHDGGRSQQ